MNDRARLSFRDSSDRADPRMDNCSLYPPNSQSLSDNIVGGVQQRAWPRRAHMDVMEATTSSQFHLQVVTSPSDNSAPVATVLPPPEQAKKSNKISGQKRSLSPLSDGDMVHVIASNMNATDDSSIVTRLALAVQNHERNIAIHRERRRNNQVRYRQKQRELMSRLEVEARQLRHEIHDLELQRHCTSIGAPTQKNLWTIATEYFRLFHHGFGPPPPQTAALNFLRASMASNVTHDCRCGPETLMTEWRLFSQYFADVRVELEQLEKITTDSLLAATSTSVTITEATLSTVFPHLNSDGQGGADGGKWSSLARKLLSQRLVLRGSVRFDRDSGALKVSRMQSHSDLLTPILRVIGNLEDVSRVFDGALVTPDGRVKSTS